jgi:hypothetical protein
MRRENETKREIELGDGRGEKRTRGFKFVSPHKMGRKCIF